MRICACISGNHLAEALFDNIHPTDTDVLPAHHFTLTELNTAHDTQPSLTHRLRCTQAGRARTTATKALSQHSGELHSPLSPRRHTHFTMHVRQSSKYVMPSERHDVRLVSAGMYHRCQAQPSFDWGKFPSASSQLHSAFSPQPSPSSLPLAPIHLCRAGLCSGCGEA